MMRHLPARLEGPAASKDGAADIGPNASRRLKPRPAWPAAHLPAALALVIGAGGCAAVGPDYTRPVVPTPEAFRGAPEASAAETSVGDQQWRALFVDEALRALIARALERNHDLRIAAARLLQTEALLGVTRANQFPRIDAQAAAQGQRTSLGRQDDETRTAGIVQLGGAAVWEVDFWGRYRRATEAARAELLATEWGRRAVAASVVTATATGYYDLLALDRELAIATRTLATREESLRLTQVRESGGATSLVDVRQAEQLVFGARVVIVDLQRQIAQQENLLNLLTGSHPGEVPRGRPLTEQPPAPEVPAGLPSSLLTRRPDIQQAEAFVVAANADIGAARAARFPQVTLTGSGGLASTALTALLSGPAAAWTLAASATQPLFDGGRIRSEVALAEARHQEAVVQYDRVVQGAFREVADALAGYQRTRERRQAQELMVTSAQDARRLSDLRYQGGVASYLEVLDSETRLFGAELDLVRAQYSELATFVEVYRALGGGWQP